jgi:cytochrome c oxidase subunit 2
MKPVTIVIIFAGALSLSCNGLSPTVEEPEGPGARPPARSGVTTAAPSEEALVARGMEVFAENGCELCHSIDGSEDSAPSLLGIWNTERLMSDGSTVRATEDYFYESVLDPQARLVRGYDPEAMPSYEDLIEDDDLAALAAYVRSLR